MNRPRSAFVVSLDFELHWGVRDRRSVAQYRENLLGVREAVPAMLELFTRRGIACTWATVGMLMCESKAELRALAPTKLPAYRDPKMSPYAVLDEIGDGEHDDPFHYAPSLVRQILATPRQELATHTFSHYYVLEEGQTVADFDADLAAARRVSDRFGVVYRSIVFPRNQLADDYLDVLRRHGIRSYRSNGDHWAYRARSRETAARRGFRLLDTYAPLARPFDGWPVARDGLVDVRASAFLRPWTPRLSPLDALRTGRLVAAMRQVAERGGVFHLWWHPHNFGRNLRENLAFLSRVLDAFEPLRARGMESLTMADVAAAA